MRSSGWPIEQMRWLPLGGEPGLPRPLTQVLWRDRADERKERRRSPVPGLQLCHAVSCSFVSPFGIR